MRLDASLGGSPKMPRPNSAGPLCPAGFTLLELIAVMCVLTILMFLALPNYQQYRRKVSEVQCSANMRSITVGLRAYLLDHADIWPEGPAPSAGQEWENFWLGKLQAYGISDKTWRCPGVGAGAGKDAPRVHYTPTMFPPTPGIANRWATQPWLIERTEGHGQGALICFPDGSVKSFDKVLAEQGVR
jgi:prepilin-type N-terminal cleavage/methylation domain-containing protein